MNRRRWVMAAGGMLVAAVMAVGIAGTAFADSSATPTTGSQPAQGARANRAQDFFNKLAQNLGISSDQMQSGLRATEKGYVDQAAQNGKISQDKANSLKEKIDASNGVTPLQRFLGRGKGRAVQMAVGKAVADSIGITPAQLKSEIQSGKTVQAVITEHNKTVDGVVSDVVAKAKTRLDTAVTNGKLSQDRENTMLDNLKTRLTNAINNNQFGHPANSGA